MKNVRPLLSFLLALIILLITFSCSSTTSPDQGLILIAWVSQQTAESMTFRIGVRNAGWTTDTLVFTSSQFCEIEVKDQSGQVVWQLSYGRDFLALIWTLKLEPFNSYVQETVWDLKGNDQEPLPSGPYTAEINITSSPRDEGLSTLIRLTI